MVESGDEQLIGASAAIRQIEHQVDDAAGCDAKILITGESGVGKEVLAKLIHERSARRSARLLTINCAGLPDSLLESELFGHVRGAFTGAYRDKTGLLELGHRGTVFMDEVGEMSLRMQATLLRFLETGEIHRVGADRAQTRVDVRLVAATNRNLREQIAKAEFREDLYFRLNVILIVMPPLRERREDVPLLLQHFLAVYAQRQQIPVPVLTDGAMARLVSHPWPGNVRELKNVVQRLTLRKQATPITVADLPSDIAPTPATFDGQTRPCYADVLFDRITKHGDSFWTSVYEPFMARDLTREDLRGLVRLGLEQTRGSYRLLVDLFRLPQTDYKRLLNFLRAYDCQMPTFELRAIAARTDGAVGQPTTAADARWRGRDQTQA